MKQYPRLTTSIIAASTVAIGACAAQQSNVDIAVDIYKSCALGVVKNNGFPVKKSEVPMYIHQIDLHCSTWTAVWTPAATTDKQPLTAVENLKYTEQKFLILSTINEELVRYAKQP